VSPELTNEMELLSEIARLEGLLEVANRAAERAGRDAALARQSREGWTTVSVEDYQAIIRRAREVEEHLGSTQLRLANAQIENRDMKQRLERHDERLSQNGNLAIHWDRAVAVCALIRALVNLAKQVKTVDDASTRFSLLELN